MEDATVSETILTPVWLPVLSGRDRDSYAFQSIQQRLPVILGQAIDALCQANAAEQAINANQRDSEAKKIIGMWNVFKYELVRNKPVRLRWNALLETKVFQTVLQQPRHVEDPVVSFASVMQVDVTHVITPYEFALWRDHLEPFLDQGWFDIPWLYTECFVYLYLRVTVLETVHWQTFDPFKARKLSAVQLALEGACATRQDAQTLEHLLQASLWGNQADMSHHPLAPQASSLNKSWSTS